MEQTVPLVPPAPRGLKGSLAQLQLKVPLVQLAPAEQPAQPALRVNQAPPAPWELPAPPGQKVMMAMTEQQERLVLREQQVFKARQVSRVQQGLLVQLELKERLVQAERPEYRVLLGQMVQ